MGDNILLTIISCCTSVLDGYGQGRTLDPRRLESSLVVLQHLFINYLYPYLLSIYTHTKSCSTNTPIVYPNFNRLYVVHAFLEYPIQMQSD